MPLTLDKLPNDLDRLREEYREADATSAYSCDYVLSCAEYLIAALEAETERLRSLLDNGECNQ